MKHVLPAALILGAASAAAILSTASAPPTRATYCLPVAYRDYEVVFGRSVLVRPVPGCNRPSLVRKVSNLSGLPEAPLEVPVPSPNTFLPRLWLFVSHLEYSLDGRSWTYLRALP